MKNQSAILTFGRPHLAMLLLAVVMLGVLFQTTLPGLFRTWQREEYSHGFLIPLIAAFLVWQKRDVLDQMTFKGSWVGVLVMLIGLVIYFLGMLASITTVDAYAMVIVIAGIALALLGRPAFALVLVPIALLFLMNPLPAFLFNNLSSSLQLISSKIGVAVIRAFGISVFLEGNVIDLGSYKLQVVEACSGLRYLFPLMTLGVIVACFFKAPMWQRWLIFLSTMPITVLMNSFRIGVIGVLVDRFGEDQAEGFLHDFEGWVIFMACFGLLFLEMMLLRRLSGDRRAFQDIFALEMPPPRPKDAPTQTRELSKPFIASVVLLALAVVPAMAIPKREELKPPRTQFAEFPLQIGQWKGSSETMEQIYIDALKLDDYVMANYTSPDGGFVNFYSAYYASQRTGQAAHSPRSCLPGGGWRMEDFGQRALAGVAGRDGQPLIVNRTVIRQGESAQLVYYWFQQRGRVITNEYMVKWWLFWDALTRNRSDGALVRLITPLKEGEEVAGADTRLTAFAEAVAKELPRFVPE